MLQHADPNQETVTIKRPMFERIAEQADTVSGAETTLTRAANAHKDAKKAYDSALATLQALTNEMIRVVNGGPSDLPLFDNMTDAIERAESDPIVKTFAQRLLQHGHGDVNLLVIAGYSDAQRAELSAYLDAMDMAKAVRDDLNENPSDGETAVEVVAPTVPAFLAPDVIESATAALTASLDGETLTDDELEAALLAQDVQMMPNHKHMNAEQRRVVRAWSNACDRVKAEKGEALTFEDLPEPPAFVLDPSVLVSPVEDAVEAEVCEGCEKQIPEGEEYHADADNVRLCQACWDDLVATEKPRKQRAGKFDTSLDGQVKAKKAAKKKGGKK